MDGLESLIPPWLRAARRAASPTRVDFHHGAIVLTVFPHEQQYVGTVAAAAGGLLAEGEPQLASLPAQRPHAGRPLAHLDWWVALHRLQARAPNPDLAGRPVHLRRWPRLTELPDDLLPAVARACALLAREPVAAGPLAAALGLTLPQALALLEVLRRQGHLHIGDEPPGAAWVSGARERAAAARRAGGCRERIVAGDRGLPGRLWERLAHVH